MNSNTHPQPRTPVRRTRGRPSLLSNTVAVLLLISLAMFAYTRLTHEHGHTDGDARRAAPAADVVPLAAPVERPIDLGKACDGRTQCSQMSSCTEAKYFLQNCPDVQMDSNRNGVPCEKTWCNSPLAR
jgi:hypothetical protein